MEGIAEHLQQGHQQQIKAGIEPELAIGQQCAGIVGRNNQE